MANSESESTLFLVHYRDPEEGKVVSLKARSVTDSTLGLSFVRLSEFVFDTGSVVVKPTEEQLQKRFEDVKSIHISIYNIIAIEEVGPNHRGLRFEKDKSNLLVLPTEGHNSPTN